MRRENCTKMLPMRMEKRTVKNLTTKIAINNQLTMKGESCTKI